MSGKPSGMQVRTVDRYARTRRLYSRDNLSPWGDIDMKVESHSAIVNRLRRAEGHLKSIIAMLEEGRSNVEVAQQLLAVGNAITNAKKTLVHEHINRCLEGAVRADGRAGRPNIQELQAITKYL